MEHRLMQFGAMELRNCPMVVVKWLLFWFLCLSTCQSAAGSTASSRIYMNQFAVHVPNATEGYIRDLAAKHDLLYLGQIGSLEDYYLLEEPRLHRRSLNHSPVHHRKLLDEAGVSWVAQQTEKKRVKRDFVPVRKSRPDFADPLYSDQWYMNGGAEGGWDMNILPAWQKGYTGKGVVVSILDDGIQTNHPDLAPNYDPLASTDINDADEDPSPRDNGDNKHGTRCAGEVAAVAGNGVCGVGVAFNASIGGVRMLDGAVNDAVEAKALSLRPDHIHVYSASWGPEDDGKTVDGPGPLAKRAFINGIIKGRGGKGSIFVWASGNGGRHEDSCNCDGYTNSIFTLSISSATQGGLKPWYLEECSSTLATTYSSGRPDVDKGVATSDMDGALRPEFLCTTEHTGTSASAPLAAGICALALEANPDLTWRDIQHLVVMTSRPGPLHDPNWVTNGVGRKVSHKFGYGLMDAGAMVTFAERWTTVPPQHVCQTPVDSVERPIPAGFGQKLEVLIDTDACAGTPHAVRYLEHVQCRLTLRYAPRGNLRLRLTSPSGTPTVLLFERPRDVLDSVFEDWPFMTVHLWGERAQGRWKLEVINAGNRRVTKPGILKKWQLVFFGTDVDPVRLRPTPSGLPPPAQEPIPLVFQPPVPTRGNVFFPPDFTGIFNLAVAGSQPVTWKSELQTRPTPLAQAGNESTSICPKFSWDGRCVDECPGRHHSGSDGRCFPCHPTCLSCPLSPFICTSCDRHLLLHDGQCIASCPSGFFEAEDSCAVCHEDCRTCHGSGAQHCLTCPFNKFLLLGTCVDRCPDGYWQTEENACISCTQGCIRCDSQACLACEDHWELDSSGRCIPEGVNVCGKDEFMSNSSTCSRCHSTCATCSGPSSLQCLSCPEGFSLVPSLGQCLAQCPLGTYSAVEGEDNVPFCLPCTDSCDVCNGVKACTKCRSGLHLYNGTCLAGCPDGFYSDLGRCIPCDSTCEICSGPGNLDCVKCAASRAWMGSQCVETCPKGLEMGRPVYRDEQGELTCLSEQMRAMPLQIEFETESAGRGARAGKEVNSDHSGAGIQSWTASMTFLAVIVCGVSAAMFGVVFVFFQRRRNSLDVLSYRKLPRVDVLMATSNEKVLLSPSDLEDGYESEEFYSRA